MSRNKVDISLWKKNLADAEEKKKWVEVANIACKIGQAYWARGKYEEALAFHRKQHKFELHRQDLAGVMVALRFIGSVQTDMKLFRSALRNCTNHVALAKNAQNELELQRGYQNLGNLFMQMVDHEDASGREKKWDEYTCAKKGLQHIDDAVAYARKFYTQPSLLAALQKAEGGNENANDMLSKCLYIKGSCLYSMSRHDEAAVVFLEIMGLFDSQKEWEGDSDHAKLTYILDLGVPCLLALQRYSDAEHYTEVAIGIDRNVKWAYAGGRVRTDERIP